MSRISQTISLLSNLSSFSVGPGTALEDDKVDITEQFLPRRQDAVFGDQFIFQTTTLRQRIDAKLVLLPPLPCDVPPFAKSVIYLSNLSGPISVTVCRVPGAETHVFRLSIFARQADVKVTLPSLFRGVVNVNDPDGCLQRGQIRYCHAVRDGVRCGLIRLDSCALEDDDEVYIHAEGSIELRLMPLPPRSDSRGENGTMGSRVGRHVRRIFGTS
ncbi:hypothetical protein EV363DRAFT_1187559 [Boletus edulis]|nr:hypothetical protein EV363DRAFT_1187559 [Boletus edulis]